MFNDSEYEQMACIAIRNYLKVKLTDEDIKNKYPLALKRLIENSKNFDKTAMAGVTSMSQGSRSITFEAGVESMSITNDVKMLLPKPKNFYAW